MPYPATLLTRHIALPQHARPVLAPALLLFFLAPFYAELLSGSSPPRLYFSPLSFIVLHGCYGALAVLLREWAVRRGLGSWGRAVLALAVGLFIEGVVCKSFFSPQWPDFSFPLGWGRLWGVNWPWALSLMLYHGLNSFLIPWLAVDLIFPQHRARPALKPVGIASLAVLLAATGLLGWTSFPMAEGGAVYRPGLLALAVAWLGPLGIAWLATRVHEPQRPGKQAFHPWALGWIAGLGWILYFFLQGLGNDGRASPLLVCSLTLAAAALGLALAWSWRLRLSPAHQFALLAGNTWFWAIAAGLQELGKIPNPDNPAGLGIVGICSLALLYLLRMWLSRQQLFRRQPAV